MRTIITCILALAVTAIDCLAQDQAIPTRRILPEDIEEGSIHMLRSSTNLFAARFTYTELGAKKMLAFRREHAGHPVLIQVGNVELHTTIAPLDDRPPGWTEEAWLKRRTDKICARSEDEVKKIMEGLKRK